MEREEEEEEAQDKDEEQQLQSDGDGHVGGDASDGPATAGSRLLKRSGGAMYYYIVIVFFVPCSLNRSSIPMKGLYKECTKICKAKYRYFQPVQGYVRKCTIKFSLRFRCFRITQFLLMCVTSLPSS